MQKISGIRVPLKIKMPSPCAVAKQVMKKEVPLPDLPQTISQATTNLVPVPDAVLDHHVSITTLNDCEINLNIEGL